MTRGTSGTCMCVCKRSRTDRSSIRMGWDHMVSEASAERFVFRARAGPLCSSECSKMHLCGHREKAGIHYSCGTCVPLQLQLHINPGLLDSNGTTPLLHPLVENHSVGFSWCPLGVNFIMTYPVCN